MADQFENLGFEPEKKQDEFSSLGFELEQSHPQMQQQKQNISFLIHPALRTLADIAAGGAQGGQGIHNAPYYITKSFSPEAAQNLPGFLQPTNIDTSSAFGVSDPNVLDKVVQGASQYGPYGVIGGAGLGGMAISGATAGLTQSETPFKSAAIDAALAPLGALGIKGVVGASKLVGQQAGKLKDVLSSGYQGITQKVNPDETAQSIMQTLGKGRSLEENAENIGNKIKSAYEGKLSESEALYKPVFNELKNNNIYANEIDNPKSYLEINSHESYLPDTKDLHNDFLRNPTLQNAHDLQSQLGYEIRGMQKSLARGTLTRADQITLQDMIKSRNALKGDVSSFLGTKDSTGMLSNLFDHSTQNFAENVAPYRNNPTLSQIAKGVIVSPNKIMSSITPLLKTENIAKVAEDIGPEFQNMIAYHKLGGLTKAKPSTVLSGLNKLEDQNSEYFSPMLSKLRDQLSQEINISQTRKEAIKSLAKGAGLVGLGAVGAPLLHHFL